MRGVTINKTEAFDGNRMGQLVKWPFERLVQECAFPSDGDFKKRDMAKAAWVRENEGAFFDSGEGGLEVWAIWPDIWNRRGCCAEGTLHFFPGSCDQSRREERLGWERHGGYPAIGAILLASIPVSFVCVGAVAESSYWCASYEDLTATGRDVIDALSKLYGCEPRFGTYLDT